MNELDAIALTRLHAGDVVLDVGAGSGAFTRAALDCGARVIAVEPSRSRCEQLGAADRLTVIHAAAGGANGTAKYVERVRRNLSTNARDAVAVPITRLDSLVEKLGVTAVHVLRIRAAGNLSAVLIGASHLVASTNVVRLVGDAIVGDEARDLVGLVAVRDIYAATLAGIMRWSDEHPFLPSTIDWLIDSAYTNRGPSTEDDLTIIVQAEGRSPDAARRMRMASMLQANPQLYRFPYPLPHVTDVLDELALDPDPATWRAAAWWREYAGGYDHRTRNARRQAAFDRQLHHLTGTREQRPSLFSPLT
jgi:FkbM family methyltransferase